MKRVLLVAMLMALTVTTAWPQATNNALIARAKSFELDTPYVPPPGDPRPIMRPATPR